MSGLVVERAMKEGHRPRNQRGAVLAEERDAARRIETADTSIAAPVSRLVTTRITPPM